MYIENKNWDTVLSYGMVNKKVAIFSDFRRSFQKFGTLSHFMTWEYPSSFVFQ